MLGEASVKGEGEKAKLAECARAGACMRAREVGEEHVHPCGGNALRFCVLFRVFLRNPPIFKRTLPRMSFVLNFLGLNLVYSERNGYFCFYKMPIRRKILYSVTAQQRIVS